jgi:hypothetical protein
MKQLSVWAMVVFVTVTVVVVAALVANVAIFGSPSGLGRT